MLRTIGIIMHVVEKRLNGGHILLLKNEAPKIEGVKTLELII